MKARVGVVAVIVVLMWPVSACGTTPSGRPTVAASARSTTTTVPPETTVPPTTPAPHLSSTTTSTVPIPPPYYSAATCHAAQPGTGPTPPSPPPSSTPWPEHVVVANPEIQVVDPATDSAFALSFPAGQQEVFFGPYRLQRYDLATGAVTDGPSFPVGEATLADGYLWVMGQTQASANAAYRGVLCQVDPETLALVRQVVITAPQDRYGCSPSVSGVGDSVWVGWCRDLVEVDTTTGETVRTIAVPGTCVASVSVDQTGAHLYASIDVLGTMAAGSVGEWDTSTGRLLATAPTGAVANCGVDIAAVPAGAWLTYRIGMSGGTVEVAQRNLAVIAPPPASNPAAPNPVFHWMMAGVAVYAGGVLWVSTDGWDRGAVVACLDPGTGVVRATETLRGQALLQPMAGDPATGTLYGAYPYGGVVAIRCQELAGSHSTSAPGTDMVLSVSMEPRMCQRAATQRTLTTEAVVTCPARLMDRPVARDRCVVTSGAVGHRNVSRNGQFAMDDNASIVGSGVLCLDPVRGPASGQYL